MPTCFVIQPFDRGPFDKRYEDVFVPAIKAVGLEPYRVDQDPGVSIPIEDIERGIRTAALCLAEISENNPNVWFELGFAIAAGKEVLLVSSASRDRFPFDVQHRNVITYKTDSARDFEELSARLEQRLKAALSKAERLESVAAFPDIAKKAGLAAHELATLVTVAGNTNCVGDPVSPWTVHQEMERVGFTKVAVTLGAGTLLAKALIEKVHVDERDGGYMAYVVTDKGYEWLAENQAQLELRRPDRHLAEPVRDIPDADDVPF